MKYPEIKLGEVADIKGGKRLPKGDLLVEFDTGFPYIRAQDIKNGLITFKEPKFITSDLRQKLKNYTVNKHDVCITIVGAYVGDVGIVPDHLSGANLTENAVKLTNFKNNFNSQYLKYALLSREAQEAMKKFGSGAAQDKLGIYKIKEIKIPNPPPEIQRKIAGILSAYDRLIENNTRRIEILEEMARSIYREWFVNFRFPGHEQVQMVDSELGLIPEGWEVKNLSEICEIIMGLSPKSEFYNENAEGLPLHQGVTNFGAWFPTDKVYTTTITRLAQIGDILFSVRAPVGRINIANKTIVIGRGICAIRSKTGKQNFVLQQLKDKFYEDNLMGGGTIYPSVTKEEVQKIKMLVPLPEKILAFESQSLSVFRQIEVFLLKNINLRQTRDLLLPRLISGEIDLENLDINTGPIAA